MATSTFNPTTLSGIESGIWGCKVAGNQSVLFTPTKTAIITNVTLGLELEEGLHRTTLCLGIAREDDAGKDLRSRLQGYVAICSLLPGRAANFSCQVPLSAGTKYVFWAVGVKCVFCYHSKSSELRDATHVSPVHLLGHFVDCIDENVDQLGVDRVTTPAVKTSENSIKSAQSGRPPRMPDPRERQDSRDRQDSQSATIGWNINNPVQTPQKVRTPQNVKASQNVKTPQAPQTPQTPQKTPRAPQIPQNVQEQKGLVAEPLKATRPGSSVIPRKQKIKPAYTILS